MTFATDRHATAVHHRPLFPVAQTSGRAVLLATLLAGCAPDVGRNLGDPKVPGWKAQDQAGEAPLGIPFDMPEAGRGAFSVLAANVGNIDLLKCDGALYKLCDAAQEKRIAERIAKARPDVALLSEVITPAQCDALGPSVEGWHACHPSNRAAEPDQVRRLLGPDYTIACEPRRGYECIAVRKGFARIAGCAEGATCRGQGPVRSAPPVAGCDEGFTLSAVTAEIDGEKVDLAVVHPPSGVFDSSRQCRRDFLPAVLEPKGTAGSLRESAFAIIGGDFNLDPFRRLGDIDVDYLRSRVRFAFSDSAGPPLAMHSGLPEHDPPYWSAPLSRATWDLVVGEGFVGRCVTLGAAADYPPLDMPQGEEIHRLDHLAQYCVLSRIAR
jgi:hypothetical protein